jgi:hypothetical protein
MPGGDPNDRPASRRVLIESIKEVLGRAKQTLHGNASAE